MAKVTRVSLVVLVTTLLAVGLLAGGFVAGMTYQANLRGLAQGGIALPGLDLPHSTDSTAGGTPEELAAAFEPFWEAWDFIHDQYVDQPVDNGQLMEGAIKGMVDSLGDQHSAYLSEEEYNMLTSDLSGELEGIGAEVDTSGDYVKVISAMPGSPAEAAGILPGDTIWEVDGVDMLGNSGTEVILKVRGPAGSTVRLTIGREGEAEPLIFDIVRAKITIASVEGRMLDDGSAYVKVNTFGEQTGEDLRNTLTDLLKNNPRGVVLDLRGNPGGYLTAAIDVVSQFIGDGPVMFEQFGDGQKETYTAEAGGLAVDLPVVVLVNEGSASASEIVAGAIQDTGRGLLVGETTYGKGTVQVSNRLHTGGGVVKLTIARWLTPDGRNIHGEGLQPDVPVTLTEEDRAAGLDPQLDAARQVLQDAAG